MSVISPQDLPAYQLLAQENIILPSSPRGGKKVRVGLLNLMPLKEMAECDYMRLLSASDADIEVTLISPASHRSKNTSAEHIEKYYVTPEEALARGLDGMIVTGAPVEKIDFESVDYWPELGRLFNTLRQHLIPTLFICWGALAGLYHNHGVRKQIYNKKISGVYLHKLSAEFPGHKLLAGLGEQFYVPHSRYSGVRREDVLAVDNLRLLAESEVSGVYLVEATDFPALYVTGHSEYAPMTLDFEYHRDLQKGINPSIPVNYYPDNDPEKKPMMLWADHARTLFANWLASL